MSVSIATPDFQIPSIHSQLATIVSEPPRELLSYLHETNAARNVQHEDLTDNLLAIEDELLDFFICSAGGRQKFTSISRSVALQGCCKMFPCLFH
jgi:hypothetical protein